MKNLFFLSVLSLLIISCQKDQTFLDTLDQQVTVRAPKQKVQICHFDEESGTYETLNVNGNALAAHLAHGDTEGPCNEIDCDPVCLFCEYIGLLDFDEPCETNNFAAGDYYCSRDISYNCEDNPPYLSKGESLIWDNDYFRNTSCNGNDSENDEGFLFAVYEISCSGTPFGQVQFYYRDYDTGEVINEIFFEASQEAYDLAVYCRSVIDSIAAQLGMEDKCLVN